MRNIEAQGTFQNLDFESASIPPNPGTFTYKCQSTAITLCHLLSDSYSYQRGILATIETGSGSWY